MCEDEEYKVLDDIIISLQNKNVQEDYRIRAGDDCLLIVRNNELYLRFEGEEYLTNNGLDTINLYLERDLIERVYTE